MRKLDPYGKMLDVYMGTAKETGQSVV